MLEKHYFDAVSASGDWWIGYRVRLSFLGLHWHYSECTSSTRSLGRSVLHLAPIARASTDGTSFTWCDPAGGRTLWKTVPASAQHVLDCREFIWALTGVRGTFRDRETEFEHVNLYSERLRLKTSPWSLGIEELLWGRFISTDNYFVWLMCTGRNSIGVHYLNSTPITDGLSATDAGISNPVCELRFVGERIPVTSGDVAAGRSLMTRLLARLALGRGKLYQDKHVARCELRTSRGIDRGAAMVERVRFLRA